MYCAGACPAHGQALEENPSASHAAGDTELRSYEVLTKAGTYAHIQNSGTDKQRFEAGKQWTHGPKYTYTVVQPNGSQLGQIAQYLADGKIKPIISKVVPLKDAR